MLGTKLQVTHRTLLEPCVAALARQCGGVGDGDGAEGLFADGEFHVSKMHEFSPCAILKLFVLS
jgi:hypothetical protein